MSLTEMLQIKRVVALSFCLLLISHGWSLAQVPYLDHYTEDDGLADNRVHRVLVDSEGIKWFGTSPGWVSTCDEHEWRSYELLSGFNTSWGVADMVFDNEGRVWASIAPAYQAFHWFEDGAFHGLSRDSLGYGIDMPSAMVFDSTNALWAGGYADWDGIWVGRYHGQAEWRVWNGRWLESPVDFDISPDGYIWFAGHDEHVYRILEGTNQWERFPVPGCRNSRIDTSDEGRLWLVKSCYDENEPMILWSDDWENWERLELPDLDSETGVSTTIRAFSGDRIWFGFSGGALWYDGSDWRWIHVADSLRDIAIDNLTQDVWFAAHDGVYVMRGGPDAWPPVWIELEALTLADPNGARPTLSLKGSAEFQMELELDLYVAVELPDASLLYAPDWTPAMAPLVRNLDVPIGLNINDLPLVELDPADLPAGSYRWFAACTHAGTMEYASNIASCEWQFNR